MVHTLTATSEQPLAVVRLDFAATVADRQDAGASVTLPDLTLSLTQVRDSAGQFVAVP